MTEHDPETTDLDSDDAVVCETGGRPELGFVRRRLLGGRRDGVELLDVTCGRLSFSILPTRGMGIWKARLDKTPFGWQSPIAGPVHPHWVPVFDPSGLGWLEGFDELLARCGMVSNGAPEFSPDGRLEYPLHGRVANLPAEQAGVFIDESEQSITVRGTVRETRFHFQKLKLTSSYRCQLGESTIWIEDRIENTSAVETTAQMLYHFNFGPPLLDEGSRLICPAREVAPRDIAAANAVESWDSCMRPTPGAAEHVYFGQLDSDDSARTSVVLHNARGDLGVRLSYLTSELPCFSFWKNHVDLADGYVVGLEPATNFPNPRGFEAQRGRIIRLQPGEVYPMRISLELLLGRDYVEKAAESTRALRTEPPRLHAWPHSQYSPPMDVVSPPE